MYLNAKLAHEIGWNLREIVQMQLLKQNRTENLENELAMYFDDDMLKRFETEGISDIVKKKRKADSDFSVLRLSKKGQDILEKVTVPEVEEKDFQMLGYLTKMYLDNPDGDRKVGNKKKVVQYICTFRKYLGISIHETYWLLWKFLQDYSYTKVLEYLFFNSNKNRYGSFAANIEDSPIFQYYNENREEVEKLWKSKGL